MRFLLVASCLLIPIDIGRAAEPIKADQFEKLHALIRPQANEDKWLSQIPWQTNLWEARKLAADGRLLNYRNSQDPAVMRRFLEGALEAWRDIPPEERARGAMKVEGLTSVDARFSPALPKGGLIVNTYARILDREAGFFCH